MQRGETLALLGTNGAGKSTILRVISGLEVPERGVVRLNGQNITYVTPEARARLGIIQLPGGKGVFPSLTVAPEPGHQRPAPRADRARHRTAAATTSSTSCPSSTTHNDQIAARLSGGQQQMLALARVLLQEPEILLIDELSLGLAPIVVERLLGIVERLKSEGQTMVIVEQSLNVALSIADRAIFLDKGSGPLRGPGAGSARARRPRPGRLLRRRRRLEPCSRPIFTVEPAVHRHRPGDDHRPHRHGHRARLPVEPGHQLRRR